MSLSNSAKSAGDILLIDDTLDNLRFLSDLLTKAGYTVRKVINGEMGLEAARLEPPDLILLDIQMPGLSGYEVCERLKKGDRTQHVPVIFLSARDEELDKVIAFETGGVDYITKPFQVVEVLARIKTHLQVNRLQQQLRLQNDQLSQEISQRVEAETALKALNQELEACVERRLLELQDSSSPVQACDVEQGAALAQEVQRSEIKSQLPASITDEFQTSLTTIATAIEQLKLSERSLNDQKAVTLICDQIEQMRRVLQDNLRFAK